MSETENETETEEPVEDVTGTVIETAESLGYSPTVFRSALDKVIVDTQAGRGGLENLLEFFEEAHKIPELTPLRMTIKKETYFFECAVRKCSEKQLKRKLDVRQKEIEKMLPFQCPKCGFQTNPILMSLNHSGMKCPNCNIRVVHPYIENWKVMVQSGMDPSEHPEAVLMYVAYDRVIEAWVATYKAFKLIADRTGIDLIIENPEFHSYLDLYHLGRYRGETKTSREEKQMLKFISRGVRAGIPVEEAEPLIRLGLKVCKYGHIGQAISAPGADLHYHKHLLEYTDLYNKVCEKITEKLGSVYAKKQAPTLRISTPEGGRFTPWFIVPVECWQSGTLRDIILEPLYEIPVYSSATAGSLQTIYAPLGGGKTVLLGSIACHSVLSKNEVVFTPLDDETNSFTLACLPLFQYSRGTGQLLQNLTERVGVEPRGIPILNLTFLQKGERITEESNPPTIYDRVVDRVVEVDDPRSFRLDFDEVISQLRDVASDFGFNRPCGIINVRNLNRYDLASNTNVDVQVATHLLDLLNRWRKNNLSLPARVFFDEVAAMAKSQTVRYAADAVRSAATIIDFIKESRRNLLSLDLATQMPLEILPGIRGTATNVFFRDLSQSKDKSQSQIDFLLDSLQLSYSDLKPVVREINNRGLLGVGFWFWHNRATRSIDVITPSPPTFCHFDTDAKKTLRWIFRAYENQTGEKVLLDSWDEVDRLTPSEGKTTMAEETAHFKFLG